MLNQTFDAFFGTPCKSHQGALKAGQKNDPLFPMSEEIMIQKAGIPFSSHAHANAVKKWRWSSQNSRNTVQSMTVVYHLVNYYFSFQVISIIIIICSCLYREPQTHQWSSLGSLWLKASVKKKKNN